LPRTNPPRLPSSSLQKPGRQWPRQTLGQCKESMDHCILSFWLPFDI
jgi:hypothetical protein